MKLVDSDLSKNMYCFTEHVINYGGVDPKDRPGKGASKDSNALKNKILKETKNIPRVIYEKEQFYKFILQLSNKSKVNLVSQTKQSVARDYRISTKQVKKVLEKENIPTEVSILVNSQRRRPVRRNYFFCTLKSRLSS